MSIAMKVSMQTNSKLPCHFNGHFKNCKLIWIYTVLKNWAQNFEKKRKTACLTLVLLNPDSPHFFFFLKNRVYLDSNEAI